jgi:hypothetical protein
MPVPVHPLLMRKEPLRNDHVQIILGPCHGDVEETALFLDLRRASGRQIRWDATIDTVQDEYRLPRKRRRLTCVCLRAALQLFLVPWHRSAQTLPI